MNEVRVWCWRRGFRGKLRKLVGMVESGAGVERSASGKAQGWGCGRESSLQAAETGLYGSVIYIVRDVEGLVEIPLLADFVVCFEDGVEEVKKDNSNVDAPSVFLVAWRARLGLRITSADGNAIVDGLDPSCYQLE